MLVVWEGGAGVRGGGVGMQIFVSLGLSYPGYQRFFSRAAGMFGVG